MLGRLMQVRLRIALGLLFVVNVVLPQPPALAHDYTTVYVSGRWSEATDHQVRIYNRENSGLTGAYLTRALSAAQNWTDVEDGDFAFEYGGVNNTLSRDCTENTANRNPIFFAPWDGPGPGTEQNPNDAAVTRTCFFTNAPDELFGYSILFDGEEDWSTDDSPTQNEVDFASVAAHEFGHATGWVHHFSRTGIYCYPVTSLIQTMCYVTPMGTTYKRSLASHDIHTFNAAYV
jgi:hypothetical protein